MKTTILLVLLTISPAAPAVAAEPSQPVSFEQYLKSTAILRQTMDGFFAEPTRPVKIDPELGYVANDGPFFADGMDGSLTRTTVQADGARTSFVYRDRKARVNTYGDSYTECNQVNDGETWQEYLAGHLGEPIRNFGTGGHGVYQAYRRMLREERTDHGAKFLVLYIWGDDSTRSLFRSLSWIVHGEGGRLTSGIFPYFPGTFTAHVEMDLRTGRFVEKENLLPTSQSQYHMTEPQWMVDHLKDDLALQLALYELGVIRDLDRGKISALAARLDFPFDWSHASTLSSQAAALLDRYAQRATLFILDKARVFARENNKELLVVLNSPERALPAMLQNGSRFDQEIVDFLAKESFDYFDMNEVHLRDLRGSHLNYQDYIKQYFVGMSRFPTVIGHYNPRGNHLFAYAIKDKMIDWLDPKPVTYASAGKPLTYEHQEADTEAFDSTIRVYSRMIP